MQEPDIIKRWHESVVKTITENVESSSGQLGFSFSEQEITSIMQKTIDEAKIKINYYRTL